MIPFGNIQTESCVTTPTPADPRCSDAAFALANPSICPTGPLLIIKPAVALTCALGSMQFRTFLIQNGNEVDVTDDTLFASSDIGIAMVGAISGNATGVSAGDATISGTYQGATARAELTVMGTDDKCCDAISVAMQLVVDNSRSMSQAFSSDYATKLSLAKAAAAQFAGEVNETKDLVGLQRFNAVDDVVIDSPTSDKDQVVMDTATIQQTQQGTAFYDALATAIAELSAAGTTRRILVLFSDGVDQTDSYVSSNNPIDLLSDFKNTGGIVICFGIRAAGKGYSLLSQFATGGFFINAYGSNVVASLEYLSGLKGYVCAGNCTPAGDVIEHKGQSNYTAFINWDVLQGTPDILGNGFYDALPGNGLYVDLRGSPVLNGNYTPPLLQSKNTFALKSGHVYRVTLDLAGNQAVLRPADIVQLRVFSDSITLLAQQIGMPDYTADFAAHSFAFTAPADMDVRISVMQSNDTGTDLSETQCGVLLGRVRMDDTTDIISMFDDDFDDENPEYVPPACGLGTIYAYLVYGYGYAYGYDCYGVGCLDSPPSAQSQDPNPLSDIEAGFVPPIVYSSTKTACATCPAGSENAPENLIPVMTGPTTPSGTASADDDLVMPAWRAFTGNPGDFWESAGAGPAQYPHWLQYSFDVATVAKSYYFRAKWNDAGSPGTWTLEGSNNGSSWTVLDSKNIGTGYFSPPASLRWDIASPGAYLHYRLNFTAAQTPGHLHIDQFMLYGDTVSTQVCKTASATSEVSQSAADAAAYTEALSEASAELNCANVFHSTVSATATCAFHLFPVTRSASAISQNSQDEADALALAAATLLAENDLDCNKSSNGQQTTINDNAVATPYPSVKFVSGGPASIAQVIVTLTNINHFFAQDIAVLLVSPSGTQLLLMANSGTAPLVNVTLVFDQTAGSALPSGAPITSGTWRPNGQPLVTDFPAPVTPRPPAYSTSLNDFIGEDANGLWALFVLDDASGSSGTLASWDLNIS